MSNVEAIDVFALRKERCQIHAFEFYRNTGSIIGFRDYLVSNEAYNISSFCSRQSIKKHLLVQHVRI